MKIIYVPSYGLSHNNPFQLSVMSLGTAEKGIKLVKKEGVKIIFSTAYRFWNKEANLKKKLALEAGLEEKNIAILPAVTDSYDEAAKLRKEVPQEDAVIVVVAQKYHAARAAKILRYFFKEVEMVKVTTDLERVLDPSRLKGFCNSSKILFVLWNWFFYLLTPLMVRKR